MSRQPNQFADELAVLAGRLAEDVEWLRKAAQGAQVEADEFDRVVEERDELRDEVARLSAMSDEWRQAFDKERAKVVRAFREGGGS